MSFIEATRIYVEKFIEESRSRIERVRYYKDVEMDLIKKIDQFAARRGRYLRRKAKKRGVTLHSRHLKRMEHECVNYSCLKHGVEYLDYEFSKTYLPQYSDFFNSSKGSWPFIDLKRRKEPFTLAVPFHDAALFQGDSTK